MYLHVGREWGAHITVEVGFSYSAISQEPRTHFVYERVGTDGVILYNREKHPFEVRNSRGTQHLPWHPEKSLVGMCKEFAHSLGAGQPQQMPTARDGVVASRIAQGAKQDAIRTRQQPALSSASRATDVYLVPHDTPIDEMDLPLSSPTTRGNELTYDTDGGFFERMRSIATFFTLEVDRRQTPTRQFFFQLVLPDLRHWN